MKEIKMNLSMEQIETRRERNSYRYRWALLGRYGDTHDHKSNWCVRSIPEEKATLSKALIEKKWRCNDRIQQTVRDRYKKVPIKWYRCLKVKSYMQRVSQGSYETLWMPNLCHLDVEWHVWTQCIWKGLKQCFESVLGQIEFTDMI